MWIVFQVDCKILKNSSIEDKFWEFWKSTYGTEITLEIDDMKGEVVCLSISFAVLGGVIVM